MASSEEAIILPPTEVEVKSEVDYRPHNAAPFDPNDLRSRLAPTLDELGLTSFQAKNWVVFVRSGLDFDLDGDPYLCMFLFFDLSTGRSILRRFGSTVKTMICASVDDLVSKLFFQFKCV